VAGDEESEDGRDVATLWVNGEARRLGDGSENTNAYSVFVSGGDVYVAGSEGNYFAALWVNGVPQRLDNDSGDVSSRYARADSVFVSGNDVCVAGTDWIGAPRALLWKNGSLQVLQI